VRTAFLQCCESILASNDALFYATNCPEYSEMATPRATGIHTPTHAAAAAPPGQHLSRTPFAHSGTMVTFTRFSDQKPDLNDLCLVPVSELFPRHSVITIDRKLSDLSTK
jgi:hypothetical protein